MPLRSLLRLLSLMVLCAVITGCSRNPHNVANDWAKAIQQNKAQKVVDLYDKESALYRGGGRQAVLRAVAGMGLHNGKYRHRVRVEDQQENTARVQLDLLRKDGKVQGAVPLSLRKNHGKWVLKIAMGLDA